MRTIWAMLAVVGVLFVVRANAEDHKQNKAWQAEYQTAHAAASTASDFEKLATIPHCTRPGNEWVGAWSVQTAAWKYHTAGDRTNAERCAKAVIDNASALKETKAKAHTIVAHGLTADGKLEDADAEYDSALAEDPNLESAKTGKANVTKAIAAKG